MGREKGPGEDLLRLKRRKKPTRGFSFWGFLGGRKKKKKKRFLLAFVRDGRARKKRRERNNNTKGRKREEKKGESPDQTLPPDREKATKRN